MSTTLTPDPDLCPVCGQPNSCAMAAQDTSSALENAPPCWCTRVHFSAGLLQQVPEAAKNKACICQRCALNFDDKEKG